MKKILSFTLSTLLVLTSCGNENDFPDVAQVDLESLMIDETPLNGEQETVILPEKEGYKDFVDNFLYDDETQTWDDGVKALELTFKEDGVNYVFKNKKGKEKEIDPADFTITSTGGHIVINAHTKCHYTLSGSCQDGQFKLYSDKKFILSLQGLSLSNKSGSAINIQKGNDGSKRCFLDIADGTRNFLSDAASYTTPEGEDEKAVVFSEGAIMTSGNGYLRITAKGKSGLASDDYVYLHKGPQITVYPESAHDGIKGKDGIRIAGGVLNIKNTSADSRGLSSDSTLNVTGGRTIIISGSSEPVKCTAITHTAGTLIVNGKTL